jgi:hypothetical protein
VNAYSNPDYDEDPVALTIAQFFNEPGSEANLRGHWSVWRGDPHPERHRAEFERHMESCEVCREFDAATPHA